MSLRGPDRPYSTKQVNEVVAGLVEEDLSRMRRVVVIKARTALVQAALAHVPPRLIQTPWALPTARSG